MLLLLFLTLLNLINLISIHCFSYKATIESLPIIRSKKFERNVVKMIVYDNEPKVDSALNH